MAAASLNATIENFHGLSLGSGKTQKTPIVSPFKRFQHRSIAYFPNHPANFFQISREVATYHDGRIYEPNETSQDILPLLNKDISKIAQGVSAIDARKYKVKYIGSDLYQGFENFESMSREELDSALPCFAYIKKWEAHHHCKYTENKKYTIVSARHHIVNLIMSIFDTSKETIVNSTYLGNGLLTFSQDTSDPMTMNEGIFTKNKNLKKICYSGFALEDLLTKSQKEPLFSITENQLDDNITLLLRCEMDAYNQLTQNYTELKCYAPLKMASPQHRKKLLKTWIQTGVLPSSDLMFGIRSPYNGELLDIEWYSRDGLYRRFNNRNLPENKKSLNFNANIAVEWSHHCIKTICELISDNLQGDAPQAFQIKVDTFRNISIRNLSKIPQNAQIPRQYL
ncbi:hypothetical protein KAFR_0E03820 [Kazachstania africana CBS 2517]|uniref:Decapping nuclease n=1 Tax=Kazachstania africana (strain ATCC 22294 / BCRC 22015 / CBS 2517 / CECT 1963 / NBRC 1671 / NRRL Y-8276) TaxID=1071382 RepID=H2AVY3_KAZAF|nr:hypothetical protein KAFR_0E03820 [Kazachstania africana CBS 2517]CCF58533.1 hypothetical protein KAFR_0E03820 [Kazachstania africana CBS 2517]